MTETDHIRLGPQEAGMLYRTADEADENGWHDWAALMRQCGDRLCALSVIAAPPQPAPAAEKGEWTETHIVDEPDGTSVGLLLEKDGRQIWSGEASDHLLGLQDDDVRASGQFVMVSQGEGARVVAQAASVDDGILIVRALASLSEERG